LPKASKPKVSVNACWNAVATNIRAISFHAGQRGCLEGNDRFKNEAGAARNGALSLVKRA
jgi:hypothetical protein